MTVTVFLNFFRNGDVCAVAEESVAKEFDPYLERESADCWLLKYDEYNDSALFLGRDSRSGVTGFAVNRPCGDERLYASLFRVLKLGDGVIFSTDGPPIVAARSAIAHLPAAMMDDLGDAIVVADGEELSEEL